MHDQSGSDTRKNTRMSGLWFIDALDARGGQCFASRRQPATERGFSPSAIEATVFLRAPGFKPVSLGVHTAALASTAGAFQDRLFLDEEREVAFQHLEHVVEFTRRVYLASGGGDGPGPDADATDPPEPSPSGEDSGSGESGVPESHGEPSPPRDGRRDAETAFKDDVDVFAAQPLELHDHAVAVESHWTHLERLAESPAAELSTRPLRRALETLVWELMLTYPSAGRAEQTLSAWLGAVGALQDAALRCSLANSPDDYGTLLQDAWRRLDPQQRREAGLEDFGEWVPVMLGPYVHWRWPTHTDALELLSRIPIPLRVGQHAGLPTRTESPTLWTLLSVGLSSGRALRDGEARALILFAAAVLHGTSTAPSPLYEALLRDDVGAHRAREIQRRTLRWLTRQLPAYAYHPDLEEMISAAPELRYT